MTERRRNALIGLFVLGGMVALGILIVQFGEAAMFLSKSYVVYAKFERVTGIREGTEVLLAGVRVGRIRRVDLFKREDPTRGVVAEMEIRREFDIPAGSRVEVVPPLMGQPVISILPPSEPSPALPRDGTAQIHGRMVNPLEAVIDPKLMATLEKTTAQIGDLAAALTPAAHALEDILEQRTIEQVESPEARARKLAPNLYTAIERLHNVLKHVETVLGDPETQSNVKLSLANVKAASEDIKLAAAGFKQFGEGVQKTRERADQVLDNVNATVNTTREHIDVLGTKFAADLDQLSRLLDHLTTASQDLAQGKGTAGMVLRDPKLYEELLLTVRRLGVAADEMQVLIKQWQQKGILSSVP